MPNINLIKTIGKILSRIKRERYIIPKDTSSVTPDTSITSVRGKESKVSKPEDSSNLSSQISKDEIKKVMENVPKEIRLRSMPLRSIEDIDLIKQEVSSGNILIVRVSPLAKKSIDDVKRAVNELCKFTESIGGDIARLGEERIVITPPFVKIWREKTAEDESTATS